MIKGKGIIQAIDSNYITILCDEDIGQFSTIMKIYRFHIKLHTRNKLERDKAQEGDGIEFKAHIETPFNMPGLRAIDRLYLADFYVFGFGNGRIRTEDIHHELTEKEREYYE